ncbi:MAG: FliH/SctL family protein [Myxococcales bacterium]|nr:FliH/SctL family protein [Myxococcales bacterium]
MARVIRGRGGHVLTREVADARLEARRVVERARAAAEARLAWARDRADAIRAEARVLGERLGREDAARLLVEATAARDRILADVEREVARLGVEIARRLVAEELALHPERIASIAAEALARVRRAARVSVAVHPDDAPVLRARLDAVRARAGTGASIEVRESPEVERGGCVVSSELGRVDARLSVRLEAIARAMGACGD